MRKLIDAIIESIPPLDFPDGRWSPDELSHLAELRETFLLAGAAALEREQNPHRWLQIGVSFADDRQRLRFLREPLRAAAHAWLATDDIRHFFFMAKPPGLRLRFCGARPHEALAAQMVQLLEREQIAGRIAGHEFGIYEAETYQFGGEEGLDIAHDFFTYDSVAILDLLSADLDADVLPVLSLTVLNQLLAQWCGDVWERWDAWSHLQLTHRIPHLEGEALREAKLSLDEQREVLELALWEPEEVVAQLPKRAQSVVRHYFQENTRLAARLRDAARRDALLYGFRKIFPFYVIFHWNRWMLGLEMQQTLAFFMDALLDPKRA